MLKKKKRTLKHTHTCTHTQKKQNKTNKKTPHAQCGEGLRAQRRPSLLTGNSQGGGYHPPQDAHSAVTVTASPVAAQFLRQQCEAKASPAYLCGNFCTDLLLRLCQPLLGKLSSPITLSDKGLQVIHRLAQEKKRATVSDVPPTSELTCSTGNNSPGLVLKACRFSGKI